MASFDMYGMLSGATEDVALFNADPVGNFNFVLTVEGIYDIPLKGVRAFQKVNQYEKIREGGVNDYVHLKRAPIQDAHTIQFERYMAASLFDPLANGAELVIPLILWIKRSSNNGATDVNNYNRKNAADIKAGTKKQKNYNSDDYDSSSVRLYIFTGATVMSKEYGALDAEHSGLCTEIITVGYKELYIVPNLYTFFGGGTSEKSIGKMGELDVDTGTRDDFAKAQKADYDDMVKEHEKQAKDAAKKVEDDKAAAKKHLEETEAAEKKRLEEEEEKKKKAKQDADAAEEKRKKQAEAAEKKAKEDEKAAEKYRKDIEKSEKERLKKEEADKKKAAEDAKKAREKRAKENKELSGLEKANGIINKRKK